jgi:hypothetical protein
MGTCHLPSPRPRHREFAIQANYLVHPDPEECNHDMATLSNNPEFGPEQAQLLQDIARNGSTDEYNSFEDLDTAVLLQSLADFEHPASYNEPHNPPEPPTVSAPPATPNYHFASHLQAAAASNGGEAAQASPSQNQSKATAPTPPKYFNSLKNASKTTKRKRQELEYESENDDTGGFIKKSKSKRRKKIAQEEADQLARGREIWGPEYGIDIGGGSKRRTPVTGSEARAAGVQSAAALFRLPSAASKKYTSKLCTLIYTLFILNRCRSTYGDGLHAVGSESPAVPSASSCSQKFHVGPGTP